MSSFLHIFEKALNSSNNMHTISFSLASLFLFLFFLYKRLFTNPSKIQNLPPSPPKLPIIGHLHQLGTHPHRSFRSLSERYGELMLMYLGNRPTVIVSSARVVKEIMKTNDLVFSNRPKFSIYDKLMYNSRDVATAPYGEYWRQMKSICVLQLLSNRRVRTFKGIREEETALLMEKIQQNIASVINLSEMLMVLTNDVVCRVAFGRKYSENQVNGVDFKEVLKEFVQLFGKLSVGDFIPWLAWVNRFNGLDARLERCAKKFDLILEDILTQHSARTRNYIGSDSSENEEAKDFVDVLLEIQKENSASFPLGRDSIKALILDTFAAGTDTVYTVLEWAMTELLRKPVVMKILQEEVRGIAGDKELISEDDLEEMKYLKAVIKETLRLHIPTPLLVPRESTQDTKIDGYDIPANTLVFVNAWAVQRDPAIWEGPEEFQPERFLTSAIDFKGTNFELIPFGGGRRICPGISLAIANIELVLANLMHRFNWTLPAGIEGDTLDMSESIGVTIHRKTPLLAVATPHIYH
ncbi:cytochrome P450 736A117 [Beta vulgaris subsp. vulgaris]|uniref:cytochrome P450 736A117 n=1 Tax=Beta vulgaris subsp. vulgaris TaxID=3555 RepID=UPI00053FF1FA|nr:cytochrome P450 736A117 [Beta vulgaris subsp. vulgaris]